MTQKIFLLFLFLACKGISQDVHIRVNLIGYEASHPKKALILSKTPINDAWFIFQENGKKVKEINPILLKGENWAPFDYYYECNFDNIVTWILPCQSYFSYSSELKQNNYF